MREIEYEHIPYGRQSIDNEDIEAVVKVLKSDFVTQGPVVGKFEEEISKKVGSKYSVAVNSATSALHIACRALDVKPGDWIWTTPITFVASANCGIYCGAKVDFVDIDSDTGLMSTEKLEQKLKEANINGTLPKVVIPVHLTGSSCEMKTIHKLSKQYDFKIIEDASHAIGGRYRSNMVGSCSYSDITVFSFHPVKIITTGEGGAATTNQSILWEKMKEIRTHGITKDRDKFRNKNAPEWSYEQQSLGYNYRMTDIQAALGVSQLKKLERYVETRNKLLNEYKRKLDGLPLKFLKIPEEVFSAVHLAVIRFDEIETSQHKLIFAELRNNGIGVQIHYDPVHLQPYYQDMGYKVGDFKNSEEYNQRCLSIPMFVELTEEQQNRVCTKIKEVVKKVGI